MTDRKLRQSDLERGPVLEKFSHLQHIAGFDKDSPGRVRIGEALKAAVARAEKAHGLQYGMQGKHIDTALGFLDKHYEGRHDLKPEERGVVEDLLKSHFRIPDKPQGEQKESA